jgi:hypothetical protein
MLTDRSIRVMQPGELRKYLREGVSIEKAKFIEFEIPTV